jgi:hypothetical protein
MHKRFSRAVLLAACLTVLGAEVHAQPGSCVTDITLVPVLVRGTGMTLESQYAVGADCNSGSSWNSQDCTIHYYADLFYTQDDGLHWYSLWGSQNQCLTVAGDCGSSFVNWIPSSTTWRTTNGFPATFQLSMWGYRGACTAGDDYLVSFQESAKVTITGPPYGP